MKLVTIDLSELATTTGGMRWQDFRRSTNVEDRRPPEAILEDDTWSRTAPLRDAMKPVR